MIYITLDKANLIYYIIAIIILIFINISFLDRLFLGKTLNWVPFYISPKKWWKALTANNYEVEIPDTPRKGYTPESAEFKVSLYDTPEEIEKKKLLLRQKQDEATARAISQNKDLIKELNNKKEADRDWLIKIQFHGFLVVLYNSGIISYVVIKLIPFLHI